MPRDVKRGRFEITPGEFVNGKMVQRYDRQGGVYKEKIKAKGVKKTTRYKGADITSVKIKRK